MISKNTAPQRVFALLGFKNQEPATRYNNDPQEVLFGVVVPHSATPQVRSLVTRPYLTKSFYDPQVHGQVALLRMLFSPIDERLNNSLK